MTAPVSPSLLELRAGLPYLSFLQPFQRPRQGDEADPGAILLAAEQHRRTGAVAHTQPNLPIALLWTLGAHELQLAGQRYQFSQQFSGPSALLTTARRPSRGERLRGKCLF